jgi:phospholipase/carboxylesterase
MSSTSIIVQQPQGPASSLVLLTHGVGSMPQSMLGVARWFANHDRNAMVVSVASPDPSDISNGLQWFSVRDVTEGNRQARVDAAMPAFVATVQHWQQASRVNARWLQASRRAQSWRLNPPSSQSRPRCASSPSRGDSLRRRSTNPLR